MAEAAQELLSSPDRLEHALAEYLRHELNAPIAAITRFLDVLVEDARRAHLDDAISDLNRMRSASAELGTLVGRIIDPAVVIPKDQVAVDAFRKRLRHDLRTPLNTIKFFGETLVEDIRNTEHKKLLHALEQVQDAAETLRIQIDAVVDRTGQSGIASKSGQAKPVSLVSDLLSVTAPVNLEREVVRRGLSNRILLVEQGTVNRDLLAPHLLREGHGLEAVEDVESAHDRLVDDHFDLILLDLVTSSKGGFEFLCRLKSNLYTRHMPVIVISPRDELDAALRCIEAGAEDYLPAPLNPILLRTRIDACLEKKWLRDRARKHLEELHSEKQRSETLLLNILPQNIVSRMRNGEKIIADRYPEATILFCDLVGFTPLAAELPPHEVLEILSTVFSRFDRAVGEHGLEKIKTIGDAYMVAGGLPEPLPNHTKRAAKLALEMLTIVMELRDTLHINLKVRIGLHAGPVVAGVIGAHKFVYDVWGDTVNTASRMETAGATGRIHISSEARRALGDAFHVEPRGQLRIKGKGMMETYFLLGANE
jgi:adenylate cyclase